MITERWIPRTEIKQAELLLKLTMCRN